MLSTIQAQKQKRLGQSLKRSETKSPISTPTDDKSRPARDQTANDFKASDIVSPPTNTPAGLTDDTRRREEMGVTAVLSLGLDKDAMGRSGVGSGSGSGSAPSEPSGMGMAADIADGAVDGVSGKIARNTNLAEISKARTSADDQDFAQSTFALKRTRSIPAFDPGDLLCNQEQQENGSALDEMASSEHVESAEPSAADAEPDDDTPTAATALVDGTVDDSAVQYEPKRHVDYLSHDWKECDISSSWRYIVLRRKDMANSARLENASWRTWTKAKYNLKTVAPETVNWLKDYDVTWLYGPLYDEPNHQYSLSPGRETESAGGAAGASSASGAKLSRSRSSERLSTAAAAAGVRPILKKKTVGEMLVGHKPAHDEHEHHHHHHDGAAVPADDTASAAVTAPAAAATAVTAASTTTKPTSDSAESTYLRHHNYRTSMHGQSTGDISRVLNRQYERPAAPGAGPASARIVANVGATGLDGGDKLAALGKRPASVRTSTSSSLGGSSASGAARRIHFNDRVEQWIAVDAYSDDDDDDAHNAIVSDSDADSDSGSDSDSEDDEGGGLFLMVRSNSSASIKTVSGRGGSGAPRRLSVAPLPATTLNYEHDDPAEDEHRAESVAHAMSHNSTTRRLPYSKYDYNSVYTEPRAGAPASSAPPPPVVTAPSSPPVAATPHTTTASAAGTMLPSQSATSLLLDQSSSSGSSSVDLDRPTSPVTSPRRPKPPARASSASKLDTVKGIATSLWHWKSG